MVWVIQIFCRISWNDTLSQQNRDLRICKIFDTGNKIYIIHDKE